MVYGSVDIIHLESELNKNKKKSVRYAYKLTKEYDKTISTILLLNDTVNAGLDSISTLEMSMKNNSYFEGSINANKEAKSIKLTLSKDSKLKLTKDSYISSLDNEDNSNSNIDFNGYKLFVNGKAIN